MKMNSRLLNMVYLKLNEDKQLALKGALLKGTVQAKKLHKILTVGP